VGTDRRVALHMDMCKVENSTAAARQGVAASPTGLSPYAAVLLGRSTPMVLAEMSNAKFRAHRNEVVAVLKKKRMGGGDGGADAPEHAAVPEPELLPTTAMRAAVLALLSIRAVYDALLQPKICAKQPAVCVGLPALPALAFGWLEQMAALLDNGLRKDEDIEALAKRGDALLERLCPDSVPPSEPAERCLAALVALLGCLSEAGTGTCPPPNALAARVTKVACAVRGCIAEEGATVRLATNLRLDVTSADRLRLNELVLEKLAGKNTTCNCGEGTRHVGWLTGGLLVLHVVRETPEAAVELPEVLHVSYKKDARLTYCLAAIVRVVPVTAQEGGSGGSTEFDVIARARNGAGPPMIFSPTAGHTVWGRNDDLDFDEFDRVAKYTVLVLYERRNGDAALVETSR